MLNFWVLFCCLLCLIGAFRVSGKVVLIGDNVTLSFEDTEANFAPSVKGSGRCGTLDVAEPLNACSHLINKVVPKTNDTKYPFVLIIRGGCSFDDKVRRAQAAGFKAAIVYDNENGDLVAMAGTSAGIKINAVFVSKASGEILAKYAGVADTELWIIPNFEGSAWSIMVISFIALLSMCAFLAACFFVRRHRIGRQPSQTPRVQEFHGMSSRLVKAMPSLTFTAVLEDDCTSRTCAICLEDYNAGEKLRILPCHHKFHSTCVDVWLISWRTFCPVCKHDARSNAFEPPASESTPLLSSSPGSVSPSSVLSSIRPSLLASSSALPVGPSSHCSPSVSRPQSIASTPYNQHSLQSHCQSPHQTTSQSSMGLRIMCSQRSNSVYSVSPRSYGFSSVSFLNSRLMSQYFPSPGNASSSYFAPSSRRLNPLNSSESASSFSPFASAHSLPECE